jgi:DNA-binding HxlR family transcriptional regulator
MKEKKLDERLTDLSLDDYCSDIMVILWKAREMRFNEIYRAMQNRGVKLSKPTLSEHLKHLKKRNGLHEQPEASKMLLIHYIRISIGNQMLRMNNGSKRYYPVQVFQ